MDNEHIAPCYAHASTGHAIALLIWNWQPTEGIAVLAKADFTRAATAQAMPQSGVGSPNQPADPKSNQQPQ
jgi:hypothetical protein